MIRLIIKFFSPTIFSEKRTHVIDDESDYFSTDTKWLNPAQREAVEKRQDELRALKYASRKDRKITFDFAGDFYISHQFFKSDSFFIPKKCSLLSKIF